jgi:hypothetical protein
MICTEGKYNMTEGENDMDGNVISMEPVMEPVKKGISGSTLKLVAIITMLIDHTAATILDNTLMSRGMRTLDYSDVQAIQQFYAANGLLIGIDQIMRLIGRLAFPIFCFLLVEGMVHTRNKWKYTLRLALFALISEVPFDLAFYAKPFYWGYQNVYFTLLIGLLVLISFDAMRERLQDKKWLPVLSIAGVIASGYWITYFIDKTIQIINNVMTGMGIENGIELNSTVFIILTAIFSVVSLIVYLVMGKTKSFQKANVRYADLAILVAGFLLAELLQTDYSGFGILTIAIMYALRKSHFKSMLGGCITLTVMSIGEFTAFFDLILIHFYNGTRGLKLKYVFYLFYPVHLFILYLICYFMKII